MYFLFYSLWTETKCARKYGLFAIVFALASSAQASSDNWVANGDGTATDTATGLIWQQAQAANGMNHVDAIAFCENLTLAGRSDWRLPNIKELQSLVDYRSDQPAMDQGAFPTATNDAFWSSTGRASSGGSAAWGVVFNIGNVNSSLKTFSNAVRCVR